MIFYGVREALCYTNRSFPFNRNSVCYIYSMALNTFYALEKNKQTNKKKKKLDQE